MNSCASCIDTFGFVMSVASKVPDAEMLKMSIRYDYQSMCLDRGKGAREEPPHPRN